MKEQKEINKKESFELKIEEMKSAGLHFGHQTSNIHPKMSAYLQGIKNNIHIINLEKTKQKMLEALKFIESLVLEEKTILLVGTKIQAKKLVQETAKKCNMPYICERWLGGILSNFPEIKKRIEYYKDLENKKEKGELEKYTKKERIKINQELERLKKKLEGIKNLEKLPDAVFILDLKKDHLAVKEAKKMGLKTIGICDTNVDPNLVDYPIPANDDAISSLKYILEKVKEVIINASLKKSK